MARLSLKSQALHVLRPLLIQSTKLHLTNIIAFLLFYLVTGNNLAHDGQMDLEFWDLGFRVCKQGLKLQVSCRRCPADGLRFLGHPV